MVWKAEKVVAKLPLRVVLSITTLSIVLPNELLVHSQIEFLGRPSFSVIQDEVLVKKETDFILS